VVEFGAKLTLKDAMYATLQKNLKAQKKFSDQVKKSSDNVKKLGKAKANPIIKVKDMASAMIAKVKDGIKAVGRMTAKVGIALKDGATAGLQKIKSMLGTLAKGATIAVGVAGAGLGAIVGGSVSEGAKLEQSKGGVDTLYGDEAGKVVMKNADMAFKTAGLSANAYMETVTSFSASLLNSLGGDTMKSAQIADMAIIDMADNANKFGTDMESIQNAYQGFAKQNYTMLDNLKLGYGGTQEEMARLLKDATKISGVKYDMSNLADVYSAIHVIQDNLGVAGATAMEASTTFSGSFASMKGAFANLLGNMATGGDVEGSMTQLIESASTFLLKNAIPMIGKVLKALPRAIKTGIKTALPQIKQAGADIIEGLKSGVTEFLPESMQGIIPFITDTIGAIKPVVQELGAMFQRVAPVIGNSLKGAFGGSDGFIKGFANLLTGIVPFIEMAIMGIARTIDFIKPIFSSLSTHFQTLFPVIMSIIQSFGGIIQRIFPVVQDIIVKVIEAVMPKVQAIAELIQRAMPVIGTIIEGVMTAISTIFPVAWSIVSPIIDMAISVFGTILDVVEAVFPVIQSIISGVWEKLEPTFQLIADGMSLVGDAISGVADFVGDGISSIAGWFGFAYGKDRVPYNNYPAILHEGEKVLTRNQADQYDRAMSNPITSTTSTAPAPQPMGSVINISKLAETVVIEKEADVDTVVERMVDRFKQLVPNMA
jgi:phage-related protein